MSFCCFAAVAAVMSVSACTGRALHQDKAEAPARLELPSTVIWYHNPIGHSPESLRAALSSKLVTHVLIKPMHRYDLLLTDSRVQVAIKIVRGFEDVKFIWGQSLWPWYRNQEVIQRFIVDPDYYVREIRQVRKEKEIVGADFTALDTEPYGKSVMIPVIKGKNVDFKTIYPRIVDAVNTATERVGKVDFVFPAGMSNKLHPYNALAALGKKRIAEYTYYDNPTRLRRIKIPHDVPGFYVNTQRENAKYPGLPFFTVEQMFLRRELWEAKDAIFVYPGNNENEVAQALVDYARKIGAMKP